LNLSVVGEPVAGRGHRVTAERRRDPPALERTLGRAARVEREHALCEGEHDERDDGEARDQLDERLRALAREARAQPLHGAALAETSNAGTPGRSEGRRSTTCTTPLSTLTCARRSNGPASSLRAAGSAGSPRASARAPAPAAVPASTELAAHTTA
jgi:hypothetical protein